MVGSGSSQPRPEDAAGRVGERGPAGVAGGWQRVRPRVPLVLTWVVRVAALVPLVEAARRTEPRQVPAAGAGELAADVTTFVVAVLASGVMLLLAGGLARRTRRAWVLLLVVVVVGTVAHLRARHEVTVAANLVVLVVLLVARHEFTAASAHRGRAAALRVAAVLVPLDVGAGLLLTRHTAPDEPVGRRLVEVLAALVGFAPDLRFARPASADLTAAALTGLGALTVLLVLVALLAPVHRPAAVSPEDEQQLRALLGAHGRQDSLGYFALRHDKAAIFSPSGKAAVAYRVLGTVSLAAGDPLGDREAWPGAVERWLADAAAHGWTPGVVGASEEGALSYGRAGLDALEVGDEAVLDLKTFSLDGRAMRSVRQAVSRVRRGGYLLAVDRQRDLAPQDLAEAATAAEALRGAEVERGFSMALGRVGDPRDGDVVLVRVRDGGGRLVAVLSFVPWGPDGLSLDVMRRARDSENGTVEFAVTGVAEAAAALGVQRLSLNFAVFRSVLERGTRVGAGPVTRLWRAVLMFASRWWQIESLYRANAKYHPEWVPRFVCFRHARDLPAVLVATLEAEAFVQRPRLGWFAR